MGKAFVTCEKCGTTSLAINGIRLSRHGEQECSAVLEMQRHAAAGDQEWLDSYFVDQQRQLDMTQPHVYCHLCKKVVVGSHQHLRVRGGVSIVFYRPYLVRITQDGEAA